MKYTKKWTVEVNSRNESKEPCQLATLQPRVDYIPEILLQDFHLAIDEARVSQMQFAFGIFLKRALQKPKPTSNGKKCKLTDPVLCHLVDQRCPSGGLAGAVEALAALACFLLRRSVPRSSFALLVAFWLACATRLLLFVPTRSVRRSRRSDWFCVRIPSLRTIHPIWSEVKVVRCDPVEGL